MAGALTKHWAQEMRSGPHQVDGHHSPQPRTHVVALCYNQRRTWGPIPHPNQLCLSLKGLPKPLLSGSVSIPRRTSSSSPGDPGRKPEDRHLQPGPVIAAEAPPAPSCSFTVKEPSPHLPRRKGCKNTHATGPATDPAQPYTQEAEGSCAWRLPPGPHNSP